MNQQLLQHQINKFGAVTVMDVVLRDPETKEALLFLDTLKITSINQEGSQKEITGGIGAPLLISYDYARRVSVEIQDALASISSLQTLWGGELIDGDIEYSATFMARAKMEATDVVIPVPTEVTVNSNEIKNALIIDALNNKTYKAISVEGQNLKIDATELPAGNPDLRVMLPATATTNVDAGIAALAVNSVSLPPTVHLTGSSYLIDQATGKKVGLEITIPLFKVNIGGGLALESEGDASVFDFNGVALADPISKNFFVIKSLGKQ